MEPVTTAPPAEAAPSRALTDAAKQLDDAQAALRAAAMRIAAVLSARRQRMEGRQ